MSDLEPPPYPGEDSGLPSYGSIPPPPPPSGGGTPPPPPPPRGGPPQYGAPTSAPPNNGLAIAALVLGIASIFGLCCYGFPGTLLGTAAIVCGHLAKRTIIASNGAQGGAGMAKAGFIMGIVGVVIGVIAFIAIVIFIGLSGMESIPTDY
jgi:hypothetical protein